MKSLPKNIKNALKADLKGKLSPDPLGSSLELTGPLKGLRSFHWRKYRIVFKLIEESHTIAILAAEERMPKSRRQIYERLELLANEGQIAHEVLVALRGFSR